MMQKASLAISEIATSSEQRPSRVLDLLVFLAAGVTIWLAVSSAIGANVLHPSGFAILVAGISGCIAAIYARLQVA